MWRQLLTTPAPRVRSIGAELALPPPTMYALDNARAPAPAPVRHSRFYVSNVNVTLQVQNTLFQIPKSCLQQNSEIFAHMFEIPQPEAGDGSTIQGQSDENPILLEGVSAADFKSLIKVLFPTNASENARRMGRDTQARHDVALPWNSPDRYPRPRRAIYAQHQASRPRKGVRRPSLASNRVQKTSAPLRKSHQGRGSANRLGSRFRDLSGTRTSSPAASGRRRWKARQNGLPAADGSGYANECRRLERDVSHRHSPAKGTLRQCQQRPPSADR